MRVDPRFERLYRKELPAVFRTAYLVSGHRQLAEEKTPSPRVSRPTRAVTSRRGARPGADLLAVAMEERAA